MNQVLIEQSPSPMKLEVLNVDDWAVARDPEGVAERYYPQTEMSYIVDGAGTITTPEGDVVQFASGDLLTIMPETHCVWYITEAIERHYNKG